MEEFHKLNNAETVKQTEALSVGGHKKVQEYINRIKAGESKDSIMNGLPESFKIAIEQGLSELISQDIETERKESHEVDQKKIEDLRVKLGIKSPTYESDFIENPPVKYIEVVIDDEFIKKNLTENGGLRMLGGQANWNDEVELIKYVISDTLSDEYVDFVKDKIKKFEAGQEKTYHHEAHHIKNRENNMRPYVVAENMREYLTFRVLDELSAFTTGELYDKEMTPENVLIALKTAEKNILDSYYGEPFVKEADWYLKQHQNDTNIFSRAIGQEKYHKVMRQYFIIKGNDVLRIMQASGQMEEFAQILNTLIYKFDQIIEDKK